MSLPDNEQRLGAANDLLETGESTTPIPPDIDFLKQLAEKNEVDVSEILREAGKIEDLLAQGVPVPNYKPSDRDVPTEEFLLKAILDYFSGQEQQQYPQSLIDYLADRGYIQLPPTVRRAVRKELRDTAAGMLALTAQISTTLQEE